jgi:hypothetical protein
MSGPNLAHDLTTPAQPSEEKRPEWPMPGARRGAVAAAMADAVPRLLAARRWLPRDEVFATTTRELRGGGGAEQPYDGRSSPGRWRIGWVAEMTQRNVLRDRDDRAVVCSDAQGVLQP